METLANINGNANSNFNNMKNINVTAASQQVAGNRAEEQEEKTNLRVIKIKPVGNAKMFRTLAKAIAAGATTLIVTTRVDVAGCGYVWFGIRKGYTELDGKLRPQHVTGSPWDYNQHHPAGGKQDGKRHMCHLHRPAYQHGKVF